MVGQALGLWNKLAACTASLRDRNGLGALAILARALPALSSESLGTYGRFLTGITMHTCIFSFFVSVLSCVR